MNNVLDIPVTVKTRTGIYKDTNVAHTLIPRFAEAGASLISVSLSFVEKLSLF